MKLIIDIPEKEYNRIRHFCSFDDNNIPLGWYEIAKSKPLQTEFKEIKEEILSYKRYANFSCLGTVYDFEIEKVFDNRIAELKG